MGEPVLSMCDDLDPVSSTETHSRQVDPLRMSCFLPKEIQTADLQTKALREDSMKAPVSKPDAPSSISRTYGGKGETVLLQVGL